MAAPFRPESSTGLERGVLRVATPVHILHAGREAYGAPFVFFAAGLQQLAIFVALLVDRGDL